MADIIKSGATTPHKRESVQDLLDRTGKSGLREGIYIYNIPDTELAHGSSFGNASAWTTSKGTGAVEGLFSIKTGLQVAGSLVINIFAPYKDLISFGKQEEKGHLAGAETIIRLSPEGAGSFIIHPAYQEHTYDLLDELHVVETLFVPNTGFDDEAAVISIVDIENHSDREQIVAIIGCLQLTGKTSHDIKAYYDRSLEAIVAWNESKPDWVRAFGTHPTPDAYVVTHDMEEAWNPSFPLGNKADETGQVVASLQKTIFLRPGDRSEVAFVIAFTPEGKAKTARTYQQVSNYKELLAKTIKRYEQVVNTADIMTPDPLINEGAQWCKANMLKCLAKYPTGIGFTNDPGKSSHVVARDAAWFVYGSDYILPEASCDLLESFAKRQKESGMIVEYFNALTGETDDYGLNINDNTPLFILAAAHHLEITGHRCSDTLYPAMQKAADYIISQEDDRGLVYCTAEDTGAKGIVGWRNIIDGKSISGAVTEVNTECYAALKALSRVCGIWGDMEKLEYYKTEAEKLKEAINKHLKNPKNGMYYLNIDTKGNPITEVTADEIFPMIFEVSDEETSRRITLRLANPDFMTSAGLRTVSSLNPLYTPDTLAGLQGGVWPGVTWWYAMASVQSDPAIMVESLKRSYRQYIEQPSIYNTVPGQFSEWFDGESLVNRGMRLSPWEPPRFLWALIEGALGLTVKGQEIKLSPRVPQEWEWIRVRNLNVSYGPIDFFAARQDGDLTYYTASSLLKGDQVENYENELTELVDSVTSDAVIAAYGRKDEIIACIGDTSGQKKPAPFSTSRMLDNARRYRVQLYQSEIGKWIDMGSHTGGSLGRLSIEIAPYGFAIFRFGH